MFEDKVKYASRKVFVLALIISIIMGVIFRTITFTTGIILGYIISRIVFDFTISITDLIISLEDNHTVLIVVMMFIGKLVIYALGILAGIFFKDYINYFAVFIGYFLIKITIFIDTLCRKEEED